jgi:hypothetical protein
VKSFALASATLLFAVAPAQNLAGKWNGKLTVSAPKMPANVSAEQKAMVQKQISLVQQMKFQLTMLSNKTFTIVVSGGPIKKPDVGSGKWTQKGSNLTLKTDKKNGKPTSGEKPLELTVSKDGKKLIAKMPEAQGKASLVFTR